MLWLLLQQHKIKRVISPLGKGFFPLSEAEVRRETVVPCNSKPRSWQTMESCTIGNWAQWQRPAVAKEWRAGYYQSTGKSTFPWVLILRVNDWSKQRGHMWFTFFPCAEFLIITGIISRKWSAEYWKHVMCFTPKEDISVPSECIP